MKIVDRRRIFPVAIAVLVLLATVPQGASAKELVPFHARLAETFTVASCDPNHICFALVGRGHASHLGETRESGRVVVDLLSHPGPTPDCPAGASNRLNNRRTATLTGENGDQIRLVLTGVSCDTVPPRGISHDSYVVTGGTGRYRGATGSGTDTVHIDGGTMTAVTIFNGTLSQPDEVS